MQNVHHWPHSPTVDVASLEAQQLRFVDTPSFDAVAIISINGERFRQTATDQPTRGAAELMAVRRVLAEYREWASARGIPLSEALR